MTAQTAGPPFAYNLKRIATNAFQSIDANQLPCIVFVIPHAHLAGRRYNGIELRFLPDCTVERKGKRETASTAVLHCRDPAYLAQFSAIADHVKETLRSNATALDTEDGIVDFVEGFAQAFQVVPGRLEVFTQLGLWGELKVLEKLADINRGLEAWTGPARYLVDFARNSVELEIKTSTRGHLHRIQHDQTLPPPAANSTRAIISLHAVRDPAGGETLDELVAHLRKKTKRKLLFASKLAEYGYERNTADPYLERWTLVAIRTIAQTGLPRLPALPLAISELDYTLDVGALSPMSDAHLNSLLKQLIA